MSKKPRYTQPGLMDPPNKGVTDPAQQQWQNQLTQVLKTGLGQSPDSSGKFLTWTDLETEGIVTTVPDGTTGGGTHVPVEPTIPPVEEDRNPPPAPVNLRANGAMTAIYLTWDDPKLGYDYRIEIHKAAVDDVGYAVLAGSGYGTIFEHIVGSDRTLYYFWARFVRQLTNDIIIGPWNQTEGTPGQASEDPQYILDQVSGRFDTDDLMTQQFNVDLFGVKSPDPNVETFAFVVDTTTDPPYVAMDGAFIVNATITDAQIANLNVDKLIGGTAEFVEANILDGTITNAKIGNVIQSSNYEAQRSGWIINKLGFAEFSNIYARGTIEGSIIRGSVIEGGLLIQSDIQITTPTIADDGPGTIRFLSVVTDTVQVAKQTSPSSYDSSSELRIFTADYTASGSDYYGDGETKEHVWTEFNRYVPYIVDPDVEVKLKCPKAVTHYQASETCYITISKKNAAGDLVEVYSSSFGLFRTHPNGDRVNGSWNFNTHLGVITATQTAWSKTSCTENGGCTTHYYHAITSYTVKLHDLIFSYSGNDIESIFLRARTAKSGPGDRMYTVSEINMSDSLAKYI